MTVTPSTALTYDQVARVVGLTVLGENVRSIQYLAGLGLQELQTVISMVQPEFHHAVDRMVAIARAIHVERTSDMKQAQKGTITMTDNCQITRHDPNAPPTPKKPKVKFRRWHTAKMVTPSVVPTTQQLNQALLGDPPVA